MDFDMQREIETIFVPDKEAVIYYLGGPTLVVKTPHTLLYVNPFFSASDGHRRRRRVQAPMDLLEVTQCDAVLVTDDRSDHADVPTLAALAKANAPLTVASPAALVGMPSETTVLHVLEPGIDWLCSEEVTVRTKPLRSDQNPPDQLISTSGGSILYGTCHEGLYAPAHVTFLEVSNACDQQLLQDVFRRLRSRVVVPVYWDLWDDLFVDPASWATSTQGPSFHVPHVGQRMDLVQGTFYDVC